MSSTVGNVQVASHPFDLAKLSRGIDQERRDRGVTLTALAEEVGVAASTIRRFKSATDAEADGVLALITWLGVPPEEFIAGSTMAGVLLPVAGTGQIRVDMDRVLDGPRSHRKPTRTTIQRLAFEAQTSERTIASLTRWCQT